MMEDRDLQQRLLNGDRQAFRWFFRKTQLRLLRWVAGRVKSLEDAEEIVQDTYLAFLDSLPLYQGRSSLETFLVSIARHEVIDYWRKRYAKKAVLTLPFLDQVYTERLFSAGETAMVIERVFNQLLPAEVTILRLKYEEGLSVREIANRLTCSVKAAESRLFRARKAFQLAYAVMSNE